MTSRRSMQPARHAGDGSRPADGFGFGREVRAAVVDTVVKVVADTPDDTTARLQRCARATSTAGKIDAR
jgi:hypothetical protein